ncbi:MAG: methane/phenol/toluene hydroxylase [Mycobacterium sp.]|jgi:propane monooxygenase small subunit|nr:methane/phenol/toluene hydroxylase [Mycobacterium sp.]
MTATPEAPQRTQEPERPARSVPRVNFTDAEAGAKTFPDSDARARHYNYYVPAKRKQTHYEDVTVEVQPDPRHYLSQGWIYGFADGAAGYPLSWTKLKAWGVDDPPPVRGVGTGGGGEGLSWPAHGWHEFRDPNEEWEQTIYRNNANVVRQVNANIENARSAKAFDQWTPNWVRFVERDVGGWMHVEHILGLYVFAANERSAPTNMHNTAMAVNSAHKLRFAQDLALYNLTLTEEIDGFDGTAHLDAWNNDPELQGVRELTEALTAIQDDWGEAIFATNIVFEPLVGELFRSGLVMQAAPGNGDFVTPTVIGAGEYDFAQRDLSWSKVCFAPLVHDREFADHNRRLMDGWLSAWVPRALAAARTMQPLWSQPDSLPPRFEDSLERAKSRFARILGDLGLETPKELAQ